MVRYWYAGTPLVIVGTVAILALPWLGLIALMAVLLAAVGVLGALVWATLSALYALAHSALGRTVPRPSRGRAETSPKVALHAGGVGGGGAR